MSDRLTYKERQEAIKEEQSEMSYDEIKQLMDAKSEFVLELDKLPKQNHVWINRGLKATCEHANHPAHEAWFRRENQI